MRDTYIHKIIRFAAVIMAIVASVSCSDDWLDVPEDTDRKVLLLYSAGFNNLSSYLKSDIQDLKSGWLPRGATLRPRSGAAAGRRHPTSKVRGGGQEEQPHVQGVVAARAQEGLEELSHVEGQERRR